MRKINLLCNDGIVIGDTTPITINYFSDSLNSIPLDITGATITFTIRRGNAESDTILFSKVAVLSNPLIGEATFSFSPTDWTGVTNDDAGIYPYDIQILLSGEITTAPFGNIELIAQQTR